MRGPGPPPAHREVEVHGHTAAGRHQSLALRAAVGQSWQQASWHQASWHTALVRGVTEGLWHAPGMRLKQPLGKQQAATAHQDVLARAALVRGQEVGHAKDVLQLGRQPRVAAHEQVGKGQRVRSRSAVRRQAACSLQAGGPASLAGLARSVGTRTHVRIGLLCEGLTPSFLHVFDTHPRHNAHVALPAYESSATIMAACCWSLIAFTPLSVSMSGARVGRCTARVLQMCCHCGCTTTASQVAMQVTKPPRSAPRPHPGTRRRFAAGRCCSRHPPWRRCAPPAASGSASGRCAPAGRERVQFMLQLLECGPRKARGSCWQLAQHAMKEVDQGPRAHVQAGKVCFLPPLPHTTYSLPCASPRGLHCPR